MFAAAVTSVTVVDTSVGPTVRFDRPFIFVFRDRLSRAMLFLGKIVDPLQLTTR